MRTKQIVFTTIGLLALVIAIVIARRFFAPAISWEANIRAFEAADRANPPPQDAVLFVGSSSIRLWDTLAQDFPHTQVINRGFGGCEIADVIFYTDRIIIPYRPRMILLYAGDNDLANSKTPQQVFEDYQMFVGRVHQKLPTTRIAFIAVKPSPARAALTESVREVNDRVSAYATLDNRLAYIDVFTPMLTADGHPRRELFTEDGLHMNADGYRLWRSVIGPYIP